MTRIDVTGTDGLAGAEARLQDALRRGDVPALEQLLAPGALYVGPDGAVVGREADLAAHASGRLRLHRVEQLEITVADHAPTGMTCVLLALDGEDDGHPFAVRMRYTRTWHRFADGWKVIAAHSSALA